MKYRKNEEHRHQLVSVLPPVACATDVYIAHLNPDHGDARSSGLVIAVVSVNHLNPARCHFDLFGHRASYNCQDLMYSSIDVKLVGIPNPMDLLESLTQL